MTHIEKTIQILSKRFTTTLECAQQGGCISLSQRVGQLRGRGYDIQDKWIDLPSGARVKAWKIVKRPGAR